MVSVFGKVPKEEELKRTAFLYDNFRYLTVFGGCYGFYHTPTWTVITLTVYVAMYSIIISGTLGFLYTSYLVQDNVSAFSQSFHLFLIGCVVLSASFTITLARSELAHFLDFLTCPHLCEYSDSFFHRTLESNMKKKKNMLLILWFCSYGTCGVVGMVNYAIDENLGNELTMNTTNVYWKGVPVIFWWPLDAHETFVGWATLLLFLSAFALLAPVMVISDIILCFYFMDHLFTQLKLLTHSIENLDERAYALFKSKYPSASPTVLENEYDNCYYECLNQNVRHHHQILFFTNLFASLASVPIGVPFMGGAMLLGLAGINLTANDDPRIGPKLLLFSLASTEALNMFLLCVYGETMQQLSSDVHDSIFYTKWRGRSAKCRRTILTFRAGTRNPIKITALKLIVLNMETFSNLVNSAYSILNLKQVSNQSGSNEE